MNRSSGEVPARDIQALNCGLPAVARLAASARFWHSLSASRTSRKWTSISRSTDVRNAILVDVSASSASILASNCNRTLIRGTALINAERVEKNYFDTHILKEDFYQQLLIEGLQQAGDTLLPKVAIQKSFRPYVEDILPEITEKSIRLVAFEGVAPEIRALNLKPQDEAWVAIGSEGGWNAFELDLLKKAGFTPFSMGPRILRTDTACIAALTLAHSLVKS